LLLFLPLLGLKSQFTLCFEESKNYQKVVTKLPLVIRVIDLEVKIMTVIIIVGLVSLNLKVVVNQIEFMTSVRKLGVRKTNF